VECIFFGSVLEYFREFGPASPKMLLLGSRKPVFKPGFGIFEYLNTGFEKNTGYEGPIMYATKSLNGQQKSFEFFFNSE
jgi:hypothetical protein